MKKQTVDVVVFEKHYSGMRSYLSLDDIPEEFLKHNKNYSINIEKEQERGFSDSYSDAYTLLRIFERREETDEEYEKKKQMWKRRIDKMRKTRFELYQKLKKEFDNEPRTD